MVDIYPAIDLMDGKVVRLTRGERSNSKVYGDPLEIASKLSGYFTRLHIVDLDGAFTGNPSNLKTVKNIIEETGCWVQVGGGFRSLDLIRKGKEAGASSLIISTAAKDEDILKTSMAESIPLTISLDVRGDRVATDGWMENSGLKVMEFYRKCLRYVNRFIYTDIERDGTLSGVDNSIDKFWDENEMIYAGGISSLDDISRASESGFTGVVVGKAIYEGNISIKDLAGVV